MTIKLPQLPYAKNALEPLLSEETITFHYEKHHQGYVNNLNKLIQNTDLEKNSLEEIIIQTTDQATYNNAAQVFNHSFYWNCMTPKNTNPSKKTVERLGKAFGSLEQFKELFITAGATLFGSGWVWLVKAQDDQLLIKKTSNAGCPISSGELPLLVVDVWEHAYYIDYRNKRKEYLEQWWSYINWEFVDAHL